MKSVILAGIVSILLASRVAFARPVQVYTYERLLKEADLVVFATATKTEGTTDTLPEDGYLTGQNTTFTIHHALQGKADGTDIKVLHFTFTDDDLKETIGNGPRLVVFKIEKGPKNGWRSEYLLFLKRRKDGRYEPVSGPIDPVDSVREVSRP